MERQWIFGVLAVWAVLVATKAVFALREGATYTFSIWDGGVIRAGKSLSRRGVIAKLVALTVLIASSVAMILGASPHELYFRVAIGAAIGSLVLDFAFAQNRRRARDAISASAAR
jgi:hypothetical protein